MKTVARLICLMLPFFLYLPVSRGQQSASAGVSATIVNPIGISKAIDLDFGNVAAGNTSGTVRINPDGTRVNNGGPALPNPAGNVTPATFNITGAPNFTYAVLLPAEVKVITNGSDNMTVSSFSSDPPVTGTLGPTGEDQLHVGATLNVGAYQPEGTYNSLSDFLVTVNYN